MFRLQIARVVAYEDLVLTMRLIDQYLVLPRKFQKWVESSVKTLRLVIRLTETAASEISRVVEISREADKINDPELMSLGKIA